MTTSRGWARSGFARYATAIGATLAAAALTAATWPLCAYAPMAFFLAAVMLAGWRGGAGPSLMAMALSLPAAGLDILPAPRFASVGSGAGNEIVSFAVASAFIAACAGRRSRTLRVPDRIHAAPLSDETERLTPIHPERHRERARLESLLKEAPAFISFMSGPDHVFELANDQYVALAQGRSLLGRTVREALPEMEEQGFVALLDRVYRTGETFVGKEMPGRVHDEAGNIVQRFFNFVYQAVRDPDGAVSGVFAMGFEVTDQVVAREALRESESRFRLLADSMPQAVWSVHPDGSIEYLNRKWREYFDCFDDVIDASRCIPFFHPDDLDRTRDCWRESLRTGRPLEIEYRLRRGDGQYRWHLGRALPVRDSEGRIIRWFGTNTDIDDAKRATEALRLADRRKDEFLATLAHELRNPLAPIRNGLQILRLGPAGETAGATLDMMGRQLAHMVLLIDDLMDVARIGSGKIALRREKTTLRAAVAAAVESTRATIEAGGHSLTIATPDAPIVLDADPTRLTQILSNLLTNAAKYTRRGGRIEVTTRREGDQAVASVKDPGVGLAPEMLSRVFEMFTQVDESVGRSQGGLGIGLTIVKRLVELHGGRIEARSEGVGRGSEFIVRFPIVPPDEARPAVAAPKGERESNGSVRVLVVDDNQDSANTMARLLRLDGHDVRAAYDAAGALTAAFEEPPDVVLLDIGLPDGNGFDVAAEMRSRPELADAMLVALTGWGQPEDRRRSREAGFDHHLVKPVDMDAVRSILAAVAHAVRDGSGESSARKA